MGSACRDDRRNKAACSSGSCFHPKQVTIPPRPCLSTGGKEVGFEPQHQAGSRQPFRRRPALLSRGLRNKNFHRGTLFFSIGLGSKSFPQLALKHRYLSLCVFSTQKTGQLAELKGSVAFLQPVLSLNPSKKAKFVVTSGAKERLNSILTIVSSVAL